MRLITFITILIVFLVQSYVYGLPAFGKDIPVTIHVDDSYRPFSFSDGKQAKGMYIDVLRTAFSRMDGFEVSMAPVPWKRGKRMMKDGDGFGLAPAYFHGHDWPYLYPYSLPFYTETIVAKCTDKVLISARPDWPEDYHGLTVGSIVGFDGWGGVEFRSMVKRGKVKCLEELKGSDKVIKMLLAKRYDCIMIARQAFAFEIEKFLITGAYDYDKHAIIQEGAVIGTDPVYIGYWEVGIRMGKYPYAHKFRKAFDTVIYQMTKSGEIEIIMQDYKE